MFNGNLINKIFDLKNNEYLNILNYCSFFSKEYN